MFYGFLLPNFANLGAIDSGLSTCYSLGSSSGLLFFVFFSFSALLKGSLKDYLF